MNAFKEGKDEFEKLIKEAKERGELPENPETLETSENPEEAKTKFAFQYNNGQGYISRAILYQIRGLQELKEEGNIL